MPFPVYAALRAFDDAAAAFVREAVYLMLGLPLRESEREETREVPL